MGVGAGLAGAGEGSVGVPVLDRRRHVAYWLRCLRTPLPHQYTANDANRLTLAFFVVSALDLLGALHAETSAAERQRHVDWIYTCQHPDGGFRAFPGTDFGAPRRDARNAVWDPANLPGTYFALAALAVLGDDLRRVRRAACLAWLRRLQRPATGSFGQTLGVAGRVEGGTDTRFGYCAAGVRWILRGARRGHVDGVPDIDVAALARSIRNSETYDGGISEEPFHEAHDPQSTIRWLLSRLTTSVEQDQLDGEAMLERDADGEDLADASRSGSASTSTEPAPHGEPAQTPDSSFSSVGEGHQVEGQAKEGAATAKGEARERGLLKHHQPGVPTKRAAAAAPPLEPPATRWAGFNGRVNKVADTCYAFWVGGSLSMLGALDLVDAAPLRRFLLERTQHPAAGGFGKCAGDPPDLFHSYLGLAALSMLDHAGEPLGDSAADVETETAQPLLALDATLCASVRARRWIEGLAWRHEG